MSNKQCQSEAQTTGWIVLSVTNWLSAILSFFGVVRIFSIFVMNGGHG